MIALQSSSFFFFFNDTATTEIYTLSLHDALPICFLSSGSLRFESYPHSCAISLLLDMRSEEHTSELQSPDHLVCRLLLEKKKKINDNPDQLDQLHTHVLAALVSQLFGIDLKQFAY